MDTFFQEIVGEVLSFELGRRRGAQKGASDPTTFSGAGGSNKNNDPISAADCAARVPPLTGSACDTWHWDAGNVPAKDDLVNAYAYAKIRPSDNHLIIYSGFERLDPNGDSHIDIEFLKDQVAGRRPSVQRHRSGCDTVRLHRHQERRRHDRVDGLRDRRRHRVDLSP
jgi:hypothetical protein